MAVSVVSAAVGQHAGVLAETLVFAAVALAAFMCTAAGVAAVVGSGFTGTPSDSLGLKELASCIWT